MIIKIIFTVLLGLAFGVMVATLFILGHIKKTIRKNVKVGYSPRLHPKAIDKVEGIVKKAKSDYLTRIKDKNYDGVVVDYFGIINETAKVFNPDGTHPAFDLSERQIFDFARSVTDRLVGVLDATEIPLLHSLKISTMLTCGKAVFSVMDSKIAKYTGKVFTVLNCINPYYWIKKFVLNFTIRQISKEAVFISIETVAEEFANLYGKVA